MVQILPQRYIVTILSHGVILNPVQQSTW